MTSPFLDRPESEWVASNGLAFAIRDRFPVSPGHTLVVPRRVVATWFDATVAEKAAVMELVDVVKAKLDAELHPDGYNVGFNCGPAAGQTVQHLHVHVIPRFKGDVADPTGGVRHVIPGKANYLRSGKARGLATGGDDDPFLRHIDPAFAAADQIAIVAAFVQDSGLDILEPRILSALERGATVSLLTGDYLAITQVDALRHLFDLSRAELARRDGVVRGRFLTRVIEAGRLPGGARSFHPKSWRFEGPTVAVAFVGSSNVSRAALETGIEWNLRLERDRESGTYREIVEAFERLWALGVELTPEWIDRYAERARANPAPLPPGEVAPEELAPPPEPHEVQLAALDRLAECRSQGHRRALVVMATGLGKTWLAVFDVAALAGELGRAPRVLFVAHRQEILDQAFGAFRRHHRASQPGCRFSWCAGEQDDVGGDVVFASVQKLARPARLQQIPRDAFDYIVIDEVHHAEAPSYRRIIDHLEPRFLLGLTATPERADEADIVGLFGDNVAYRADLGDGISVGRLVPFDYFGLRDTVDYDPANIPWRNRRFDLDALERAVETEQRMLQMWGAWVEHPGRRSIVFCCSIRHARFVERWLKERGVRAAAVFSGPESADRARALGDLEAGQLDAICAVDVFNEGVDVPAIDRVIMLRPTESPVVFIQQLGRGLRRADGKERLTVIDFVGNHRVFLNRVRNLLSLAGRDARALPALLEQGKLTELPSGCSIEIQLEAVALLAKLLPRGAGEVQRAYREIRDGRDERPTRGEMVRMGFNPRRLREVAGSWFEFVEAEGDLTDAQRAVLGAARQWLVAVETTPMTKCFKMVTLQALAENDAILTGMELDGLADASLRVLRRSPGLLRDIEGVRELGGGVGEGSPGWRAYWRKNPIAAWTGEGGEHAWFVADGRRLVPTFSADAELAGTLAEMTRELVDSRLAEYLRRSAAGAAGAAFECKLTWNQRDPIIKLPSRESRVDLPEGETDVRLPDGSIWQFRFAKEYCNVARPAGTTRNQLPDLVRRWFGPAAGRPGTDFHVRFSPSPDGLWVEPVGGKVLPLPVRGRVVCFPELRAAAGAASADRVAAPDAELVSLPIADPSADLFAVRATGDSMDGGKQPIRDGDWMVMRLARAAGVGAVEGRVALVQSPDPKLGFAYQVKRVVRDGQRWVLRSDNPERPSYDATAETVPLAILQAVIQPESLAPTEGTELAASDLAGAFQLSAPPVHGRVDGHLFLMLEDPAAFGAPDRAREPRGGRRPGETAFVLLRVPGQTSWRYCGVGRWSEEEGCWTIPALDFATWRALGEGRSASRTLPVAARRRAEGMAHDLLARAGTGGWLEQDGKRVRVIELTTGGGLVIDGGPGGFAPRTITTTDLGWAILALDDAHLEGGTADEARVNRLRYIEGTPKSATRWIDTGWALMLARAVAPAD